MSVARLRGSPQRCSRSAIGDAIAESNRPMMTGTSTTDSCPNTRRNTYTAATTSRRRQDQAALNRST